MLERERDGGAGGCSGDLLVDAEGLAGAVGDADSVGAALPLAVSLFEALAVAEGATDAGAEALPLPVPLPQREAAREALPQAVAERVGMPALCVALRHSVVLPLPLPLPLAAREGDSVPL